MKNVADLLKNRETKIHCIGIGGSGMSSLALFLKQKGYQVSGSDITNFRLKSLLESNGIEIDIGDHNLTYKNSLDANLWIYSTAIKEDNLMLLFAKEFSIPHLNRFEALKMLFQNKKVISITGSYGKSTTSTFTASLMKDADFNPSWIIGADSSNFAPAKATDNKFFVFETDESKQELLDFDAHSVILTNIGRDHLPNYNNSHEKLTQIIVNFLIRSSQDGRIILNSEDQKSWELIKLLKNKNVIYCGSSKLANYQYYIKQMSVFNNQIQTFFDIKIPSGKSFDCCLKMPGEKNVIDAVMAFALTYELCGNLDKCIFGVNNLPVIERRFEVCHTYKETIIVDDEGDSPEVIKNVFQNIKSFYPNKKIFAVLQPHRFSRLNSLFEDYVNVMANNSDDIIVLPVFSAGEFQNESEKNSGTLVDSLIEKNFPRNKIHLLDIEEAILLLKKYIGKSYVIITLGPGDVWRIAHAFREK